MAKKEFHSLGQSCDISIINTIKEKFTKFIEDEKYSVGVSIFNGKSYQRHIRRADYDIPEIGKILTDEIVEELEEYYDVYFIVNRISGWRNYGIPDEIIKQKELLSDHWHCDHKRTDYVKLFINLTDDDGPFHVISREKTKEILRKGYNNRNNYNISEDEFKDEQHIFRGIGPVGTGYFANTELCLHKAGIPKVGHFRDLICLRFEPSDKKLESNWIEHVDNWESEHQKQLTVNGIND